MAKKLYTKKQLGLSSDGIDSVKERRERLGDSKKNLELLERCAIFWENMRPVREARERCKRYTYGDQWGDIIKDEDGKYMTESEYLIKKGNVPLKNNLLLRLVNNVSGLYTKSKTEPTAMARDVDEQKVGEMMTITLQCNWQTNKMPLLLANLLEDALIGGIVAEREFPDFINGQKDILSTIVTLNDLIMDSGMSDPRMLDMELIGQIHDISPNELLSSFSKSPEQSRKLREMYQTAFGDHGARVQDITKKHESRRMSFWSPSDTSRCRVYEIWTKEVRPRWRMKDPMKAELFTIDHADYQELVVAENKRRRQMYLDAGITDESQIPYIETVEYTEEEYWFFQFLSPAGDIILEGESPFHHKSHPYTVFAYPFIDGEIHSYINVSIDQQRYINRLLTIDDWVRRTGAKGVTLVPAGCVPPTMTFEEFAKQWTSVDGLIVYEPKPGVPEPKQFFGNSQHLNTVEMVQLQMQLMEDSSSVHPSMQGKQAPSGTSALMYAQQAQNSTTSLATLLMRFEYFVQEISIKKTKLIQQFYDEKRIINIAGKNYTSAAHYYDPAKAANIEFDLSISESAATPVSRMATNDLLLQFFDKGAIDLQQVLENGNFPFGESLLQSLKSRQEEAQQRQETADPANMQAARQMLMK